MGSPPGNGIAIADLGFVARKKRSCGTRRPCSEPQRALGTYGFFPPSTSTQNLGAGYGEESSRLSQNTVGEKNGLKKLKLKVGGVTRTIHTSHAAGHDNGVGGSYASKHTEKQPFQKSNFGKQKVLKGKESNENECEPTRKSKRVPKRRKLDLGFDEDADFMDEEIRYLGRINATRVSADCEDYKSVETGVGILEVTDIGGGKRSEKLVEDDGYMEEGAEELVLNDEPERKMNKSGFAEGKNDRVHVVKQDVSLRSGSAFVEFPDGLPDAPKKSKANFPDVEKQLKKAEAAQKRKLHAEKLAKEAEAEAIRKILGQDSARKKKEEKMKKQRDDIAQLCLTFRERLAKVMNSEQIQLDVLLVQKALQSLSLMTWVCLRSLDQPLAAILHLERNVQVRIARMLTSIEILSRSFPCVVFIVTRQYKRRCSLYQLVDIIIIILILTS